MRNEFTRVILLIALISLIFISRDYGDTVLLDSCCDQGNCIGEEDE